jgi:hypothetical protein
MKKEIFIAGAAILLLSLAGTASADIFNSFIGASNGGFGNSLFPQSGPSTFWGAFSTPADQSAFSLGGLIQGSTGGFTSPFLAGATLSGFTYYVPNPDTYTASDLIVPGASDITNPPQSPSSGTQNNPFSSSANANIPTTTPVNPWWTPFGS